MKALLATLRAVEGIKALAHITGGGFPENIPRVLPKTCAASIDLGAITVPPVFGWLARSGGVAESEMLRTFNCGIGMIVVVASDAADGVSATLREAGEAPVRLGRIVEAGADRVTYIGRLAL